MATKVPAPRTSNGTLPLQLATAAAILFSFGGIALAALANSPADGGRGGAIAVALTFFMLFMGRGTAEQAAETTLPPSDDPVEALRREFDPTKAAVNAMLDWSNKEKRYLAASSVIGTLVWGFGDLLAAWICAA